MEVNLITVLPLLFRTCAVVKENHVISNFHRTHIRNTAADLMSNVDFFAVLKCQDISRK